MQKGASSACAERTSLVAEPESYSLRPDGALESPIQATLALSEMCKTPQVRRGMEC
jgi:hypothetical protein